MDDLISRAAAIDALCKDSCGSEWCGVSCQEVVVIENLPSAQPDLCDGCDRYGASCVGEGCGKLEMPEVAKDTNVPNNDSISRQSAIDAVNNIMPTKEGFLEPSEVLCELMQLPPAQQETCDTCKYGYFGDGMCDYCRVKYQSHYERRTDEQV